MPNTPLERRSFLQRAAAGAAALLAGGFSVASAQPPRDLDGEPAPNVDAWLDRITGKHKQVFDCTTHNDGFGAAFGLNLIDNYKQVANLKDSDVSSVVVFRHFAMPLMLNDSIWAKYHIGELINVKDPKTGKPATRNIFRDNIFGRPGLTYERAIAERGLIMCACNMALTVLSEMTAPKAGTTAEAAKKEWTANLLKGVNLVPSGVYAVNRSQEKGCAYCNGG